MKKKLLYMVVLTGVLYSCSKSDDENISAPEVTYQQTLTACLFQEGSSAAPTINWNGDEGQFGLQDLVEGVSINPQTGVILWDKTLALGLSEITVLAFNNGGTTTTTVTIDNQLVGNFGGSYTFETFSNDLDLNFSKEGTGVLVDHGVPLEQLMGNWTIEDGILEAVYPELDQPITHYIDGQITISQTGVTIHGKYSRGYQLFWIHWNF